MPTTCCIKNCKSVYTRKDSKNYIKHFQFPRNKKLLELWIKACKIKEEHASWKRVCSLHFTNDDWSLKDRLLHTPMEKRRLNESAVPSRYLDENFESDESSEDSSIPEKNSIKNSGRNSTSDEYPISDNNNISDESSVTDTEIRGKCSSIKEELSDTSIEYDTETENEDLIFEQYFPSDNDEEYLEIEEIEEKPIIDPEIETKPIIDPEIETKPIIDLQDDDVFRLKPLTNPLRNKDMISIFLKFLKARPYFYDKNNPIFFDASRKRREKEKFAKTFNPPLNLMIVSNNIRYIIKKVIDDAFGTHEGRSPQWSSFNDATFMIPAFITVKTELPNTSRISNEESDTDDDFDDASNGSTVRNKFPKILPKGPKNPIHAYCKICDLYTPLNLHDFHFGLLYHKREEIIWKKKRNIEEIQCPSCELTFKTWCDILKHLFDHNLTKNDINYKIFTVENKKLFINLSSQTNIKNQSTAQLYYEKRLLTDDEIMQEIKKLKN